MILGRKPAFLVYVSAAAALVPAFGFAPAWASESWMPLLAPLLGFFGSGYFSLFGAMLAELFPNSVRCTGQGFTYNLGRGVAAFAPFLVGAVADRSGFGPAIALNSAFYIAAGALILALPETKHVEFHQPIHSKV